MSDYWERGQCETGSDAVWDMPSIPVKVGLVRSLPNQLPEKPLVAKLLEESAEVYSAWENFKDVRGKTAEDLIRKRVLADEVKYEVADVMQVCANILAALERDSRMDMGIDLQIPATVHFEPYIQEVWQRNHERGRC